MTHRRRFVPAGSSHREAKRAREELQRKDAAAHEQGSPHPVRRREPRWCTRRLLVEELVGVALRSDAGHTVAALRAPSP